MSSSPSSVVCFILLASLLLANNNGCQAQKNIGVYELQKGGMTAKFTNYGAIMFSFVIPDKKGNLNDVVLGYDSIDEYKNDGTYFGAIVGRVANRIAGAQFSLNGTHYELVPNEGKNMLHGGPKGYSDVIWSVYSYKKDSHITFTYDSFDGEEGFPGNVSVSVTYLLIGTNKLGVKMVAKPLDKPTPVNLAFHVYWNLGGHTSGNILSNIVQIFGSAITPVDDDLIPTGKILPVKGTPYDFSKPHKIDTMFNQLSNGYDINYVLDSSDSTHLRRAAVVQEPVSGRKLELWTNQPGVQFYSGNQLHQVKGKGGFVYRQHAGLCLETQGFPDSVNHPNFPSQIVNPGETYEHVMLYRFTAE